MLLTTKHSQKRAAQRAISSDIISLAFNHGECLDLPCGVSRIYCPKKRIKKLEKENLITVQQAKKLKSTYLVVAQNGNLMTTGHQTKKGKRPNWKYTKNTRKATRHTG